ncbi:MAG: hypothetical protein HYV59_07320 [Planctomycetes bacterium]|nr:hypothetical protein [Planctomycetota bacterium]
MDIYEMREKAPLAWFNKSSDLRASAGAIWICMGIEQSKEIVEQLRLGDDFRLNIACRPVYRMLCGMSLELIFKAIIVAKGNKVEHTHDLVDLALKSNIKYDKRKQGILKIFSESIIWDGRYPVPRAKGKDRDKANDVIKAKMAELNDLYRTCASPRRNNALDFGSFLDWNYFNEIWSEAAKVFQLINS